MCFYIILPIFAENKRFMETLRIKEQCKKRGMTMAELASKLGITPVSFSQALKNGISVARLYKIAEVLKVDVVDLLPPQEHKRPAIDGFIDIERKEGTPLHISTPVSQVAVHKLRGHPNLLQQEPVCSD